MLPPFLERYLQIRVEVTADPRYIDVVQSGVDLVIRIGSLPDSSLVARRLPPIEVWLCAAPAYLARKGTPEDLQELASHELLALPRNMHWTFNKGRTSRAIEPRPRVVLPDAAALHIALEGGAGIGCIPIYFAAPAVEAGRLVRVLPSWKRAPIEIHAVYPTHRSMSPKIRAFIDALAAHLECQHRDLA